MRPDFHPKTVRAMKTARRPHRYHLANFRPDCSDSPVDGELARLLPDLADAAHLNTWLDPELAASSSSGLTRFTPAILRGLWLCGLYGLASWALFSQLRRWRSGVASLVKLAFAAALVLVASGVTYFLVENACWVEVFPSRYLRLSGGQYVTYGFAVLAGLVTAAGAAAGFSQTHLRPDDDAPGPRGSENRAWSSDAAGDFDVFISSAADARPEAIKLARRLDELKLSVWFDSELLTGLSFDAELARMLRATRCIVVGWSPGALESPSVGREASTADKRGILINVLLRPAEVPEPLLRSPPIDLTEGIETRPDQWRKLVEQIGEQVSRPGLAPYVDLQRAPDRTKIEEWQQRFPTDPLWADAGRLLNPSEACSQDARRQVDTPAGCE